MRKLAILTIAFMLSLSALSQNKIVRGRTLKAGSKEPLAGVTIKTKNGTTTSNENGEFQINAEAGETLTVSYVGMKELTVRVSSNQPLNIQMADLDSQLNQVVVTGYTSQRKADLTGSVAVVNVKDIKDIPTGNPMQSLQGRV